MFIHQSRAGVPSLWNLMPYDLRWGLCNNNRNKVHNECKVLESSGSHPTPNPATLVHGKVVFYETGPGCRMVGDL